MTLRPLGAVVPPVLAKLEADLRAKGVDVGPAPSPKREPRGLCMIQAQILKEWFGVQPAASRVAAALFAAAGKPLTKAQLMEQSGQTAIGVGHSLQRLRLQMDPGAIEFSKADGYRLTVIGMADCARAIEDAAQRAAAERSRIEGGAS